MEAVTLTRTTVQTVHQSTVQLDATVQKYAGVLALLGRLEPPVEGWTQTTAVFLEPRRATSYVNAVRKMEGVAEVQKRADKVEYLPLDVASWTEERKGGRLRLVLQGKSKGTMFSKEYERDGLLFGTVGQSNPVARYFRPVTAEPVLPAGEGGL